MPDNSLQEVLTGIRSDDIRLDPYGRVVITSPSISEKLKGMAELRPDELSPTARNDTNIICCGNTKCGKASDLGSLVERFTGGALPPGI